jgi:hypothetical protein
LSSGTLLARQRDGDKHNLRELCNLWVGINKSSGEGESRLRDSTLVNGNIVTLAGKLLCPVLSRMPVGAVGLLLASLQ